MTENIKSLLITLTPVDTFFFGGERTFNPSDDEDNYFVTSNYFPQQTALLGLLRYMVLQKHGRLNKPSSETEDLIGPSGFVVDAAVKKPADYGMIQNISPLFIRYEGSVEEVKNYVVQSKDYGWDKDCNLTPLTLDRQSGNARLAASSNLNFAPLLNGYVAKNGLARILVEGTGKEWKHFDYNRSSSAMTNGIFISDERVGIKKPREKRRMHSDLSAYYRQTFFRLRGGYSFAFFSEMSCGKEGRLPLQPGMVLFGGERSIFNVGIIESPSVTFDSLFGRKTFLLEREERKQNQIVLTSDAYVNNGSRSFFDLLEFSVNTTIDFRYVKTPGGINVNFAKMSYEDDPQNTLCKSGKHNLIERGSVFWLDDANLQKARDALNLPIFQQIGYNKYVLYKRGEPQ